MGFIGVAHLMGGLDHATLLQQRCTDIRNSVVHAFIIWVGRRFQLLPDFFAFDFRRCDHLEM